MKKIFLYALMAILTAILNNGCSSKQPIVKYPKWFSSSTTDTRQYYYGIGEGENKNNASTNALNEIASKISTSISSTIDTNTIASISKDNKQDYSKSTVKNIINEVKKIEFSDYEVLKTKKLINNRHIALIRINRIKNALLIESKIKNKLGNYENIIENKTSNIIQNLKTYSKIVKDIDTDLLPKYFTSVSLNKENKNITKRMSKLKSRVYQYKNNIVFNISSNNKDAKEYKDTLIEHINNIGYVAKDGYKKDAINIVIDFKEKSINILDSFIFKSKITTTITLKNKILDKKIINIGAKSRTSFSLAKAFAIKKLEQKLLDINYL